MPHSENCFRGGKRCGTERIVMMEVLQFCAANPVFTIILIIVIGLSVSEICRACHGK